jgi:hypothetical protein
MDSIYEISECKTSFNSIDQACNYKILKTKLNLWHTAPKRATAVN